MVRVTNDWQYRQTWTPTVVEVDERDSCTLYVMDTFGVFDLISVLYAARVMLLCYIDIE